MSKNFSLEQLTEGIRQRHLGSQNRQLVEKWARTGLLRGLEGVPPIQLVVQVPPFPLLLTIVLYSRELGVLRC